MTFDAVEQWRDEFLHHADVEEQRMYKYSRIRMLYVLWAMLLIYNI